MVISHRTVREARKLLANLERTYLETESILNGLSEAITSAKLVLAFLETPEAEAAVRPIAVEGARRFALDRLPASER